MFRRMTLAVALMALPGFAVAGEMVRYQCKEWKAKHIHDEKKADTISATLKKLGCEMKKDQHDGHIDVKYRCPEWRELKLDSHDEAHKWEKWLKEYGFQTEHKH
ncbi:hypothetical protein Poly51_20550 [Rubripirellula tenax]|uniref:Uncharacterized protein n=1 Tax=Rubripirellula tenax TaxID=2528015 RepID=A0A5C6FCT2_9BACT|nr:hypothetical protein [Rubripirellula tenax]TWU59268.1 hypothetical protein Poly51_20550 [Rubripirellula tenax]